MLSINNTAAQTFLYIVLIHIFVIGSYEKSVIYWK